MAPPLQAAPLGPCAPVKILVTGGAGFLGRHVTRQAAARGHDVVVLSRHPERIDGLPAGVTAVAGNLSRPDTLTGLAALAPAAVVHAAAIVADDDPRLHNVNVEGTRHLMQALAGLPNPPRVVAVSSFAVEDVPVTAYSASKLEAEQVVRDAGLPFVVVRPALIYGPGDGTNTPALVERLRAGSHWIPAGGRAACIQPVHVDDVAAAIVRAVETPGIEGRTYRLAGPEPITVRAWRDAVLAACGGQARIRSIPLALFGLGARALALLGKRGPLGVYQFHRAEHAVDIAAARADLDFDPRDPATGLSQTFAHGRLLSDRAGPRPPGAA